MQISDQKGNLPSIFYGDIINKAKQFKYDTSELVRYLKKFIPIGYDLAVKSSLFDAGLLY